MRGGFYFFPSFYCPLLYLALFILLDCIHSSRGFFSGLEAECRAIFMYLNNGKNAYKVYSMCVGSSAEPFIPKG